ncbi:hypothetical protein BKA83DRAFT_4123833 [Pisolithus microcarpus]|nr:hypothetical protein BKA83DRAFT_4123833 [Pisolithus microcarpus]
MSPFIRDIRQILLDNGSALHELWVGMNPPKDENSSGGSGMMSRHYSISITQPNNPLSLASMPQAITPRTNLGSLSLSKDWFGPMLSAHLRSQPSSFPIYAPILRSPLSSDWISPYQCINLNTPTGTSLASHQQFGSPSDIGYIIGKKKTLYKMMVWHVKV